jgi:hypothetical protein
MRCVVTKQQNVKLKYRVFVFLIASYVNCRRQLLALMSRDSLYVIKWSRGRNQENEPFIRVS